MKDNLRQELTTFNKKVTTNSIFMSLFTFLIYYIGIFMISASTHYIEGETIKEYSQLGIPVHKGKLIMMLVDGLSYRFANSSEHLNSESYQGKLTYLQELAETEPKKTIHKLSITEAPTWTLHGIKSLITGSAPTESVADMLMASDTNYETILNGLNKSKKNYFFGDVYWKDFVNKNSEKFKKIEYLNWFGKNSDQDAIVFKKIKKLVETGDFDVIFTHFSDIDSSVHKKGLSSKTTIQAMKRDDHFFRDFFANVDDNTTVLITSDHGLVETGHGGASVEEKMSIFFAYRKNGFLGKSGKNEKNFGIEKKNLRILDVTDLICYYLGVSPPMNSLGNIEMGFLPLEDFDFKNKEEELSSLKKFAKIKLTEIFQRKELIKRFEDKHSFPPDLISHLESIIKESQNIDSKSIPEIKKLITSIKNFLDDFSELFLKNTKKFEFNNFFLIFISTILILFYHISKLCFFTTVKIPKIPSLLKFVLLSPISIGFNIIFVIFVWYSGNIHRIFYTSIFSLTVTSCFLSFFRDGLMNTLKKILNLLKCFGNCNDTFIVSMILIIVMMVLTNDNYVFSMIQGPNLIQVYFVTTLTMPWVFDSFFSKKKRKIYYSVKDSLIEFILFLASSLGDVNVYSEGNLEKLRPYILIFNNRIIELGDFLPGIFLSYFLWKEFSKNQNNKLKNLFGGLFVYYLYKIAAWKQKELVSLIGEHEHHLLILFLQWIILILCVYSIFDSRKKMKNFTKKNNIGLIIQSLIPLILVIGYSYSSLHILVLFLLLKKNSKKKKFIFIKKSLSLFDLNCSVLFLWES